MDAQFGVVQREGNVLRFGALTAVLFTLAVGFVSINRLREQLSEITSAGDRLRDANAALLDEAEQRNKLAEQLRQSQKMGAVGQLTGGVAHDFNNLLTVVAVSAEALRRRVSDPKSVRSLDMISTAVDRGAALTRQLLSFAGRQTLKLEVFDLREHVLRFEELIRRTMPDGVQVVADVPETTCFVKVDPDELDLALLNLAINARDAMPHGGRLTIGLRAVTPDGREPAVEPAGAYVALSASDSGSGIAPDVLQRVFEPFFTTKESGKGTGLGLSQVCGFARRSGGVATIDSKLGSGTTVTLFLRTTTDKRGEDSERQIPDEIDGSGKCILVMEDDPIVAEVLRGHLHDMNFEVELASPSPNALSRLAGGRRFDAALLDIVAPGDENGLELARQLRGLRPELPILLLSGPQFPGRKGAPGRI